MKIFAKVLIPSVKAIKSKNYTKMVNYTKSTSYTKCKLGKILCNTRW